MEIITQRPLHDGRAPDISLLQVNFINARLSSAKDVHIAACNYNTLTLTPPNAHTLTRITVAAGI
jgi:hypothetical protein